MRRFPLLIALLTLLALAPSALADTRYVVRGAGYGHGVGLSQYGAYGFAKQGRGYRTILAHYYRGTKISKAPTEVIRVLLQSSAREATFSGANRIGTRRLRPGKTYSVRRTSAGLELRSPTGRPLVRLSNGVAVTGAGPVRLGGRSLNGVRSGTYHGALELRAGSAGGVTAVNAVDLDDYLQGVVPGEVPTSWPAHALRAQAVAARSYAVAGGSRGGSIFDVYPDTRSQVYRGVSSEHPRTSAAVRATAGKVVSYKGKVITAFFFSTSGGRTEDNENIFGGTPQPYLRSVNDPYDNAGPRHRWSLTFTRAQLKARLGSLVKGDFQRIEVLRRGSSPRVLDAVVVGTQGRTQTKGTVLRTRLGLYDTWAYFTSIQTAARTTAAPAAALARARPVRADGILRVVLRATVSLRKEARRPVRRLSGSILPTRAARRLRVERLEGRGRRTVARGRTGADGAYRVELRRPGRYRVRANGIVGPVVRVR